MDSPIAKLLARIDAGELPEGYEPAKHQEYVDRRMEGLTDQQRHRISQLWQEKQRIDPDMPNRGFSFVRIMTYVAEGETRRPLNNNKERKPDTDIPTESGVSSAPESKASKPVNHWKWSAETDAEGESRKAFPIKISEERTFYVAPFDVAEGDTPPIVLLPESRLQVSGRVATAHPVLFGITIQHPNGDFAGRFVTDRAADEFENGDEFQVTLAFQDFQLDSSLAEMKDKLPRKPFHFVVETIWFTTLEKKAGLEIAGVNLIPPSQDESD